MGLPKTEGDWLAYEDAGPMLTSLRGKMSDRKLRLFAVAVARLFGDRLSFDQRKALAVAERLADGRAAESDRLDCADQLWYLAHQTPPLADLAAHRAAATAAGRRLLGRSEERRVGKEC